MKTDIHPEMKEITIRCACGAEYKTTSSREDIRVEICSQCHPLYTGKKKVLDAGGRVERFQRKYGHLLSEEDQEIEEVLEEAEDQEDKKKEDQKSGEKEEAGSEEV